MLSKVTSLCNCTKNLYRKLQTFRTYQNHSNSNMSWVGDPVNQLVGDNQDYVPPVRVSTDHAVLYQITRGPFQGPPQPYKSHAKWSKDCVRMPCPNSNMNNRETSDRWDVIKEALSGSINNAKQLKAAILSYNEKYQNTWKFTALLEYFNEYLNEVENNEFFVSVLPGMVSLALQLPELIQAPIPLLKQHTNKSVSLSQQQVASLIANAFFCTFPRRNSTGRHTEFATYPNINFTRLYEQTSGGDTMSKLDCIIHYFRRVTRNMPTGVVTFTRRWKSRCPDWGSSNVQIKTMMLHVDSSTAIEDATGLIQVDFANKYLGGGVLGHGSVQEEIRFVICPELIVSKLFIEVLDDTEAVMMIGCERYSNYAGYSRTFRWVGDHVDATPRDASGRRRVAVLAIDAKPVRSGANEFQPLTIRRELNKAWVGMSFYTESGPGPHLPGVATGNWGGGAFGGNISLKSLIQMMACAEADRPMAYYTFNHQDLMHQIHDLYKSLEFYNVTVGQLFKMMTRPNALQGANVFEALKLIIGQNTPDADREKPIQSYFNSASKPNTLRRSLRSKESNQEVDTAASHKGTPGRASTREPSLGNGPLERALEAEKSTNEETNTITNAPLNDSPDVFSEPDDSELLQTLKPPDSNSSEASTDQRTQNKRSLNQTLRLFDEMSKLDEDNGKLLLNAKHKDSSIMDDTDPSMNVDKSLESPEVKKKISDKKRPERKITDYFSKK